MATTVLRAGAEIDVLSPGDLEAAVDRVLSHMERGHQLGPTILRRGPRETIVVDGGGNLGGGAAGPGIEIYRCPVGTYAIMHRFSLAASPGASGSPSVPLTAGWVALYVSTPSSDALVTFAPQTSSSTLVLPLVISEGNGAIKIQNGESIQLVGGGLPPGATLGCLTQIELFPETPAALQTVAEF
jgi:hypothetical protein